MMLECGDVVHLMHKFFDRPLRVAVVTHHEAVAMVQQDGDLIVVPLSNLRTYVLENPNAEILMT